MIGEREIRGAEQVIRPHIRRTPILEASPEVFLKLELLQHTGSFKPRGAFNRILTADVPPAGVIAASGGNHGIATAYAARTLGLKAEIFVPTISSPAKVERLRAYGPEIHIVGANYGEALMASNERAAQTGALVVHAYNHDATLAGQGTVGLEMDEQIGQFDTVLVATGGGGLIGGIAAWFQGRTRVISVEPELAPCLARALEHGAPVDSPVGGIAADSLGATSCGSLMFPIAQRFVERAILVYDSDIANARRVLWDEYRLIAEPGGATAMAALLSGKYQPQRGERVVILVCGANVKCDF